MSFELLYKIFERLGEIANWFFNSGFTQFFSRVVLALGGGMLITVCVIAIVKAVNPLS